MLNYNYMNFGVRFEVLIAVTMKVTVVWDVTPCSLVNSYHTTLHHTLEDSDLNEFLVFSFSHK
jgi:hypothetical protein